MRTWNRTKGKNGKRGGGERTEGYKKEFVMKRERERERGTAGIGT